MQDSDADYKKNFYLLDQQLSRSDMDWRELSRDDRWLGYLASHQIRTPDLCRIAGIKSRVFYARWRTDAVRRAIGCVVSARPVGGDND
jgi:hypothetical protein